MAGEYSAMRCDGPSSHLAASRPGVHSHAYTDQIKATDEHIRTTKAHLNVLIEMCERHLRDSHGERPS
jgi:hypothetical protein